MAANNQQHPSKADHLPLHLDALNQWFARIGMGQPLSDLEFYVLQRHPHFSRLGDALDCAVGMDPRKAKDARNFIAKILDDSCTAARKNPPPPPPFNFPKTLGQFNSFIQHHMLGPLLSKDGADALKERLGHEHLESLMDRIHRDDTSASEACAELSDAIKAVQRRQQEKARTPAPAPRESVKPAAPDVHPQQPAASHEAATASAAAPGAPATSSGAQGGPVRHQARAYGKRFAMCAEIAYTAGDIPTIKVEMAPAIPGKDRAYSWSEKLIFQLTRKELLVMTAVLLGMADSCRFDNHGVSKVKWLQVAMQDRGVLYLSMGDKGIKPMGVPVSEPDVKADLYVLAVTAIQQAYHVNDIALMIPFIRSQVAAFIAPARAKSGEQ